eukprot:GGOE01018454.1.p1 GENE.GGOE01018454.1~~GGOE01018454.1.p1  ORF type:complete len:156 (+),score=41.55 GGOE01018454.1:62-469(+)
MTDGAEVLMERGTSIEMLTEEILTDEQLIKDADQRRNQNREALRAMQKKGIKGTDHVWVFDQDTFVQMSGVEARALLSEHQAQLDVEVNATRDGLKQKMNRLAELKNDQELQNALKGFELRALKDKTVAGLFDRR